MKMVNSSKFFGKKSSNKAKPSAKLNKLFRSGGFTDFGAPDAIGYQLDAIAMYDGSRKTAVPLPDAIQQELLNMPQGAQLVIANTTEKIIPTQPPTPKSKQNKKQVSSNITNNFYNRLPAYNAAIGFNPNQQRLLDQQSLNVEKQNTIVLNRMDRSIKTILKYLNLDLASRKKESALINNVNLEKRRKEKELKLLGDRATKKKKTLTTGAKVAAGIGLAGAAILGGQYLQGQVQNSFNEIKNFIGNSFLGKILGFGKSEESNDTTSSNAPSQPSASSNETATALPESTASAASEVASAEPAAAPVTLTAQLTQPSGVSPIVGDGNEIAAPQPDQRIASNFIPLNSNTEDKGPNITTNIIQSSDGIGGAVESPTPETPSVKPLPNVTPIPITKQTSTPASTSINPDRSISEITASTNSSNITTVPLPVSTLPQEDPGIPYGHLPEAPSPDNYNIYSLYIQSQTNIYG